MIKGFAALALVGAMGAASANAQEAAAQPAQKPADQKPAKAEAGVEEIIVTSRFREEDIQTVPLAVSQFSEEAIKQLSPSTLQDFDGLTPNVFIGMNAAGPGASAIYIRGLGYADIEKTQTPNVGVVIDGVFVPSSTGQLIDTFDIESIEVNRGPQAILWGRNTSGGTIVVRRGRPNLSEFQAKVVTTYGNYIGGEGDGGALKVQSVANIPIIDEKLALRAGYTYKNEEGYWRNTFNGDSRGAVDYNAINTKLLFQPVDAVSVLVNWDWIQDRSDILPQDARWDGNDPWINRSDRIPHEKAPYDVSVVSGEINVDLPFEAKLTSITAYWKSHDLVYQDFDAGFSDPTNPSINDPQGVFARLHTRREQQYDVFSQEIRLVGSALDGSLNYTTGFYFAHDKHHHTQRTEQQLQIDFSGVYNAFSIPFFVPCGAVLGPPFSNGSLVNPAQKFCVEPTSFSYQNTHLDNSSWALFGSLEYEVPFIKGLRINGGVRYIKEQKDFDTSFNGIANNNIVGSVIGASILSLSGQHGSWSDTVGEAGVNYEITENLFAYYRFAQGFRSGGFSLRGSQPSGTPSDPRSWPLTFNPESTNSHEAGVKSAWLDRKLVANFATFYNKVEGGQGSAIISGVTPVGTNTLILNGGTFSVYGVEFQSTLEVLEGLNVDFTLGWQKAGKNDSTQNSHNLPSSLATGDTLCFQLTGKTPAQELDGATCPSISFKNFELARVPELTWSIGGNYRLGIGPGDLVLSTRFRHNDFFWIIPPSRDPSTGNVTNTPVPQNGYTLIDANVSYEWQMQEHKIRAGIVGHNLANTRYKDQELPLGAQGGFRGWGAPRYIGGELEFEL